MDSHRPLTPATRLQKPHKLQSNPPDLSPIYKLSRISSYRISLLLIILLLAAFGLINTINSASGAPRDLSQTEFTSNIPGQAEIPVTEDTYVSEALPDANNGSDAAMTIGRGGTAKLRYYILVKFDLSSLPRGAVITSANLELYFVFNRSAAEKSDITSTSAQPQATLTTYSRAITSAWTEGSVTWNNKPTYSITGDPSVVIPDSPVTVIWDVTHAVSGMVDGTYPDDGGIEIQGDDNEAVSKQFYAREAGTGTQPKLIVSYYVPTATITKTRTPTITITRTPTPTNTPTITTTRTPTTTSTSTVTHTPTQTLTPTNTTTGTQFPTNTSTITLTPTRTLTQTKTPTQTQTSSPTSTGTLTKTVTVTPTPTYTRTMHPSVTFTPTATQDNICDGRTITIPISKDAYVQSGAPGGNYGSQISFKVGKDMSNFLSSLLYFPLADNIPAGKYIYTAVLNLRVKSVQQGAQMPYQLYMYSLATSWLENSVTYANMPAMRTVSGLVTVNVTSGWIQADLFTLTSLWQSGSETNEGFAIAPISGDYIVEFDSRESANDPYISITCGNIFPTARPTITKTPTPTKTRTPTKTPTNLPPPQEDLQIFNSMEVTQGLQDFSNTVEMIEGRRTFVRLYARVLGPDPDPFLDYHITAVLGVYRNGNLVATLSPINSLDGFISIPKPYFPMDRADINQNFLFEIPTSQLNGTISLIGLINPGGVFPETDYTNNQTSKTISFTGQPAHLNLVLYEIGYRMNAGDPLIWPDSKDPSRIQSFMMRMYPLSSLSIYVRYHERTDNLTAPACERVNGWLNNYRDWDKSHDTHPTAPYKYYGLVSDAGEFMRGCAAGIPATSASGPTGIYHYGWDTDGTFGDWYTSHELGHTFGESHPGYCGQDSDTSNHYSGGHISEEVINLWTSKTLMGFDTKDAYGAAAFTPVLPSTHDIMTYCEYLWVSDITYRHVLDYLDDWKQNLKPIGPAIDLANADMLVVDGTIDALTGAAVLQPMYVLPQIPLETPIPGEHTILLRNGAGLELARYPFNVDVTHEEDFPIPAGVFVKTAAANPNVKSIHAMVPYVAGTTRVEILDPDGVLLGYMEAGANAPVVNLTSPNGGELVTDGWIATWTASDVDGDPLTYNVEFSADNGVTWELIAQSIPTNQTGLYRMNLKTTTQGLLRVAASDGIHTTYDVSDAVFSVANQPPQVELLQPTDGAVFVAGQTIYFEGFAYSADNGSLIGDQLTWVSDRDGTLGTGIGLSLNTLSAGEHTITLWADDGNPGGLVAAAIKIIVYATPADMPPQPDVLSASPAILQLYPMQGVSSSWINIRNTSNSNNVLNWTASADQTWLQLSANSGSTPDELQVSVDWDALPEGDYSAWVTITWGTQEVKVLVEVTVQYNRIYMPILTR